MWPGVNCSDPEGEARIATTRLRAIRERSSTLHAYITNAAGHQLRLYPPGHPFRTVLTQAKSYHERKALEAVSNALAGQPGTISDDVLLTFFITIFPAGEYDDRVPKYPVSPLAKAQGLHLYANMDVTPGRIQQIHRLSRLLDTRGGLDGISQNEWVTAVILYVELCAMAGQDYF